MKTYKTVTITDKWGNNPREFLITDNAVIETRVEFTEPEAKELGLTPDQRNTRRHMKWPIEEKVLKNEAL